MGSSPTFGTLCIAAAGGGFVSDEIYHLQIDGEQRGPYTRRQIDHQLNSGIISDKALYVREGMEDWAPVTSLVPLRRKRKKWKVSGFVLVFILFLLVIAHFLAPVAFYGWLEVAQYHFTEKAAYWRSRDAVRNQALPEGATVKFGPFESAHIALDEVESTANVDLTGEVTHEAGHTRPGGWHVVLFFDRESQQWTATSVEKEK